MTLSKRLLIAAAFLSASFARADIVGPPAGNYIRNQTTPQARSALNVTSATVHGLTPGTCVQVGSGGLLTSSSGPCGSGGGSGPTGQIVASPQFSVAAYSSAGSTTTVTGNTLFTMSGSNFTARSGASMLFNSVDNSAAAQLYNPSTSGTSLRIDGNVAINAVPASPYELIVPNQKINTKLDIVNGMKVNFLDSGGNADSYIYNPYGVGTDYVEIVAPNGVGINVANSNFSGLSVPAASISTMTISSMSVSGNIYATGLTVGRCVEVGAAGLLTSAAGACGTGSGGGGSGTVIASAQFRLAYYSAAGSTNTVSGSTGLTTDGSGSLTAVSLTAPTGSISTATVTAMDVNYIGVGVYDLLRWYSNSNGSFMFGPNPQGAGRGAVTGNNNLGLGPYPFRSGVTGNDNFSAGNNAINPTAPMSGSQMVATGNSALLSISSGFADTAYGYQACAQMTTASFNSCFGANSLYSAGQFALPPNVVTGNTGSGYYSGGYLQKGSSNTFLGSLSGVGADAGGNPTGTNAVKYANNSFFIGPNTTVLDSNTTYYYSGAIGAGAQVSSSNTIQMGGASGGAAAVNVRASTFTADYFGMTGTGNPQFYDPPSGLWHQMIGSTVAATAGQLPVYVDSNSVIPSTLRSTLIMLDANGVIVSTTITGGGSATPGGGQGAVQYNNAGSLAGANGFQWNGTSVTVLGSSFTIMGAGSGSPADNATPGLFNIFMRDSVYSGQRLVSVGSQLNADQFFINQGQSVYSNYGFTGSEVAIGAAGASLVTSIQSSNNRVDMYNSTTQGMILQTGAALGRDIQFYPETVLTVQISSNAVTVFSSETVKGAGGLGVTYGVVAGSVTASTTMTMPNGSAPTATTAGQVAFDTTAGQLIVNDGVDTQVVGSSTYSFTFSLSSGTGWNGITQTVWRAPTNESILITKILAESLPTSTTVQFQLDERAFGSANSAGSNVFSVAFSSANNTGVTTTGFNDASIASQASLVLTTPSANAAGGTPTSMTATVYFRKVRQ